MARNRRSATGRGGLILANFLRGKGGNVSDIKLSLAKKAVCRVYVPYVIPNCEKNVLQPPNQEGLFMKERFSKMLLTGVLSVLLGASMSNLSADQVSWDRGSTYGFDNCCDQFCGDPCWYDQCGTCCSDPCFSFAIDWLYWDVCQEDVDIAILDSDTTAATFANAETKFFDYRYKSGFRLFASWHMPCDCLSLDFVYTYFHPRFSNRFTPPLGGNLLGTVFPFPFTGPFSEASTAVKWKYDMYDLLISKTICLCEGGKIRPYAGFRALVFRQHFDTDFFPAGGGLPSRAQWRFKFPAYGFTLGAEGKYHICGCVSFIGRFGVSLLGGTPEHHNEWLFGTSQFERRKHCQIISGWDGYAGFAYDTTCSCYPVDFAVGYEFADWWNTPQRARFVNLGQVTGDSASRLTLHGLFVRGGISF
jgi:hypothetical protein